MILLLTDKASKACADASLPSHFVHSIVRDASSHLVKHKMCPQKSLLHLRLKNQYTQWVEQDTSHDQQQ
eukprot:c18233_g1_i3 orf=218-424(+)